MTLRVETAKRNVMRGKWRDVQTELWFASEARLVFEMTLYKREDDEIS